MISNIQERRSYINNLLDAGINIDNGMTRDIARSFGSSLPAILNDIAVYYGKTYYHKKPTMTQNVRCKKMGIAGILTETEWRDILWKYNYQCANCGTSEDLTIDHIIPISRGGTNTSDNVQPLCKSCNSRKSNKL